MLLVQQYNTAGILNDNTYINVMEGGDADLNDDEEEDDDGSNDDDDDFGSKLQNINEVANLVISIRR